VKRVEERFDRVEERLDKFALRSGLVHLKARVASRISSSRRGQA